MKKISLLFENEYCMVLDKPAGLAVQGGQGIGVSLDSILAESFKVRPLLVHRLDRDTSGVILIAKNREAAAIFSGMFGGDGKRTVTKQYIAAVNGVPKPEEGTIRFDLTVRGRIKKTETSYRLLAALPAGSLLELELGTGRMHQIRRHLMLINHPILGDDKYGDFTLNKQLRKTMGLKHLLLHANRLAIEPCGLLPDGLDIKAPLPEYFPFPAPS
ncbi:MAG: RluA family pseudouridine synthase [Treponema sp.]|nr:RluA family pseudouridine synthase [Treponema sp.]